jgi:hypothetical protein
MIFLLSRAIHHKYAGAKVALSRNFLKTMSVKFTYRGWEMRAEKAFGPPIKFYCIDK